jgi:hypothetical protein
MPVSSWDHQRLHILPVNISLMQDWLVLLGKNHRIIEINMLEGPEPITIDPNITNM